MGDKVEKIYTKSGDGGQTGLIGGKRVSKSHLRLDLYGEVDDLNSWVGVVVAHLSPEDQSLISSLEKIQNWLFDLGSYLACEKEKRLQFKLPTLTSTHAEFLEREMDEMAKELKPLKNFILPGGGSAGSFLHLARTKTRKIERKLVRFQEELPGEASSEIVIFANRLSDYFFIAARWINQKRGMKETLWCPSCPV